MAMDEMLVGLRLCPACGSQKLIPVIAGKEMNFFCEDCVLCWHREGGRTDIVDPQTCPGCQLGTTACFERWGSRALSRGSETVSGHAFGSLLPSGCTWWSGLRAGPSSSLSWEARQGYVTLPW